MYGTGRISDIILFLKSKYNTSILNIPTNIKVDVLCDVLGINNYDLDNLIIDNSPVMRTVKGHVFETFFDHLIRGFGYDIYEIGGDQSIDRIVNNFTLQLKTPTISGSRGEFVQYKTHKTHGAKSEIESIDYYHHVDQFADFLVGLISYSPLELIFISKEELPRVNRSTNHIKSPFTINWKEHIGRNNFSRINVIASNINNSLLPTHSELLPRTSNFLNVNTGVIVDTILKEENFRMWDMAIRGFARETAFRNYCASMNIKLMDPSITNRHRYDKADSVIFENQKYTFLQMKGISTNNCNFSLNDPIIATETQLTRGRVNDHATQSRLYLVSDFDYLVLAIDPPIAHLCNKQHYNSEFYLIPTYELKTHHIMPHRLKSLQTFKYSELQKYKF